MKTQVNIQNQSSKKLILNKETIRGLSNQSTMVATPVAGYYPGPTADCSLGCS